jgi:NADPH-dependent 2,4-dienoyl-CoA reductase/sulfur reductase-like enzyme
MLQPSTDGGREHPREETPGEEEPTVEETPEETAEEPRAALVIGGGIAGIQAAIDLANSNLRVYLPVGIPTSES